MYNNIQPINFKARLVFKRPKTDIKPYINIGGLRSNRINFSKKPKPPSLFEKLIFGIKKHTKLPTNKV